MDRWSYDPDLGMTVTDYGPYIRFEDHESKVEKLTAKINEARRFAEKACEKYNKLLAESRKIKCVYCDFEYSDGTPVLHLSKLTSHIAVCEKHPMRKIGETLCKNLGINFPPTEETLKDLDEETRKTLSVFVVT